MTYLPAAQTWLTSITVMQQSVLFSAIRGPDGFRKRHPAKPLLKFYRRCILISAFEGATLSEPYSPGGGSFTGPSIEPLKNRATGLLYLMDKDGYDCPLSDWPRAMETHCDAFVHSRDEMTLHYYAHAMHAFEILGYKHPDTVIRAFWHKVYFRMCNALHLPMESEGATAPDIPSITALTIGDITVGSV